MVSVFKFEPNPIKVQLVNDISLVAKSLALTMSTGVGSVPIPDEAKFVGVNPATGSVIRVGLEAPEADGAKTGAAALTDLKKGIPVTAVEWTWFNLPSGINRVLHVKGGATDVVEVAVM